MPFLLLIHFTHFARQYVCASADLDIALRTV